MHEYSIVEQVVEQILRHLEEENIESVQRLRFQRGSTFAEEPLRQAWEMLTENTLLEGAALEVEEYVEEYACANCGLKQIVHADDLIGHMFICPACGAGHAIQESAGLKLLEIEVR